MKQRGVHVVETLHAVAGPWVDRVSEIQLSRPDRIALRTVEPGPLLLLDPENFERNVRNWLELEDAVRDRVGRADYVDLRWRGRIAVMPAKRTTTVRNR